MTEEPKVPTVKNREELLSSGAREAKELALELFESGLSSALPGPAIRRQLDLNDEVLTVGPRSYDLDEVERILVLGGGKASLRMARSLEDLLGSRVSDGLVIVKSAEEGEPPDRIEVAKGSHPLPEEEGVRATEKLLRKARSAGKKDLVIALISGGGSSLLVSPQRGVGLKELRELTELLLESGASIDEINTVRKTLSDVKGGRLAREIHPARTLSLIVSDVVGDDPRGIASGPTVPDETGPAKALEVLRRQGLHEDVPDRILAALTGNGERKLEGPVREDRFKDFDVFNRIIVSNETALSTIAGEAKAKGVSTLLLSSRLEGESRELGQVTGQLARSIHEESHPLDRPGLLLSGGETTVSISGDRGTGGPNGEFVLAAGLEIQGVPRAVVGALDSDGEDGSTETAGGLLDGSSLPNPEVAGSGIENHDSSRVLEELNCAVLTGPTGTNVNDLRLALLV